MHKRWKNSIGVALLAVLSRVAGFLPFILVAAQTTSSFAAPEIHSGDTIVFLGDSITAGNEVPTCFPKLVVSGLKANGIEITGINNGHYGFTSADLLANFANDVLPQHPAWLVLNAGVNDAGRGVKSPQFLSNMEGMVQQAQNAGIKIVLLTTTFCGEDTWMSDQSSNQDIALYNPALRDLASRKHCLLADVRSDMDLATRQYAEAHPEAHQRLLFTDAGTHMNPLGFQMFAKAILRVLGLDAAQLAKARTEWLVTPEAYRMENGLVLTIGQYEALDALTVKTNQTPRNWLQALSDRTGLKGNEFRQYLIDQKYIASSDTR